MIHGIPARDEVNPAIVWELNLDPKPLRDDTIYYPEYGELSLEELFALRTDERNHGLESVIEERMKRTYRDEWLKAYNDANEFINAHEQGEVLLGAVEKATGLRVAPLAYRLDVQTETMADSEDDPFNLNKIGGIPHPVLNRSRHDEPRPLDRVWPKCPTTGEPMQFVGQFTTYEHRWVAHQFMATNKLGREYPRPMSGLGWSYDDRLNRTTEVLHQFFYSDANNFESPNSDAIVISHYLFDDDRYALEGWTDEVQELQSKRKDFDMSTPLGLRNVTGYKIGFDIDTPYEGWGGVDRWDYDDLLDAYNDKYGRWGDNRCDFRMFGAPRSQQTEKRFFSSTPMSSIVRMMPMLNWDDDSHDITRQMYGDLRHFRDIGTMFCRMDNSNT